MSSSDRPGRRRRRRLLALLATGVLALLAWTGVQVWLVADDLRSVRSSATPVAAEFQAGETTELEPEVDRLREHAGAAADRTDSVTWKALSALPVVGDDAEAVARLASAAEVMARKSLTPLVETGLAPDMFTPRRGRVPLEPVEDVAPALAQSAEGTGAAADQLGDFDPSGLLAAVRAPYDEALAEVARADRAVSAAAKGAELLPGMLGEDGPRTYLVVFQNSAEVRSLGGMPGIVTTLTAEDGRLSMGETIPTSSFGGELARPVLPLTDEERRIWYDQPGTYFQDAVFIPDFPRASELMAARFAAETGQHVDGVLSVDPAAMSYVVGATGGLTVEGIALTQDSFVEELVHQPYLRFADDPEAEDAFFAAVAEAVVDDALGGGADARSLVEALGRGVDDGRVLLHSFDEREQAALSGMRIAGELPADPEGPMQVGVYASDSTGSKMSYFLRHNTTLEVTSCRTDTVEVAGRLTVSSDTPEDVRSLPDTVTGSGGYGVPRGVQLDTFTIVGPVGGGIADIEIDGEPTEEDLATYRGRPVAKVPVWLEPQATVEVTWRLTGPTHGASNLELRTTPTVDDGGEIAAFTLSCDPG